MTVLNHSAPALILFLAFALLAPRPSLAEAKIYYYNFEIENTPLNPGRNLAAGLKILKGKNCIDLRETGAKIEQAKVAGSVGLILNEPLSASEQESLYKSLCAPGTTFTALWLWDLILPTAHAGLQRVMKNEDWLKIKEDCKVTITEKSAPLIQVKINGNPFPPSTKRIPPLSPACKTGEYADSWNKGMSNPEAESFKKSYAKWAQKKKIPSPFEYAQWLSLTWPNEGEWHFGNALPSSNEAKTIYPNDDPEAAR